MVKQLVLEEQLKRYGVTLRYVYLPLNDTAEARLLKNIRSSIAEYEREEIAFRTSRGRQTEQAISRLRTEREGLDVPPAVGLDPNSVLPLEQVAAEVRAGLGQASPAEQARIYTMLRLLGQVRLDSEHGVKLGRRHHFSIAWEGAVSVPDTGREYKKTRVKVLHP